MNLVSSVALPSAVTAEDFKRAAGHWTTGVAVITAFDAADRPQGLTMSAVTSLSLDPMLFLICIDLRSSTLPAINHSRCFTINILAEHQATLCGHFASKHAEKFSNVDYRRSLWGPALPGSLAALGCAVVSQHPGGDHLIIVGQVMDIQIVEQPPLTHYSGRLHSTGLTVI